MPGSRFGDAPVAITSPSNAQPLATAEQHRPLGQVEAGGRLAEPPLEVEVVQACRWPTESSVDSGGFVPASTCFESGGRS